MEGADIPAVSSESVDYKGDLLDPRIQTELEKLNKASEDINRLELELDDARATFRQVLSESTQKLNALAKKLGTCIEKARPYYEARMQAKEAQLDTQNAALRFERACGQLAAAKEMVFLAEQGFFKKGQPFDPAWQEMLNHATMKVNDAERERLESEVEHKRTAYVFNEAEQMVKLLQKELKRSISKSRPYFEMKAKVNQHMEDQKKRVGQLESDVTLSKKTYKEALRSLEAISDAIHQQRREARLRHEMGARGSGVGAEAPSPPPHSESSSGSTSTPPGGTELVLESLETTDVTTNACNKDGEDSGESVPDRSQPCSASQPARAQSPVSGLQQGIDRVELTQKRPAELGVNSVCGDVTSEASHTSSDLSGGDSTTKAADPVVVKGQLEVGAREAGSAGDEVPRSPRAVPTVELTTPTSHIPVSPGGLTSPDSECDLEQTRTNAEIMDSLQRAKVIRPFLRANRRSQDDLLSEASDSESMTGSIASANMLDDEQIESLMLETGDYSKFISRMGDSEAAKWKRMSLPTKLGYLEQHIDFKPVWIDIDISPDGPGDRKIQGSSIKEILSANKAPPNPQEIRAALLGDTKVKSQAENRLQEVVKHPLQD